MPCQHTIQIWYKDNLRVCQYGLFHGWPEEEGAAVIEFLKNNGSGKLPYPDPAPEDTDLLRYAFYETQQWLPGDTTNIEALKQALDADMTFCWADTEEYRYRGATSIVSDEVKADHIKEHERISDEACSIYLSDDILSLESNDLAKFLVPYKLFEAQSQPELLLKPSLSRACGAGILGLIANATEKVPLNLESIWSVFGPSIMWHYIIDLDEGVFEIYHGLENFQPSDPKGRFDNYAAGEGSRPRLVRQYTFEQLAEVDASSLREEVTTILNNVLPQLVGVEIAPDERWTYRGSDEYV